MFKWLKNYFKKKKYNEYMQSKEWAKLRQLVIKRDGGKCFLCSSTERLEAHHLYYPRKLKNTKMYQVITLCRKHHKAIHKKLRNI